MSDILIEGTGWKNGERRERRGNVRSHSLGCEASVNSGCLL
jgi:hypothetical protein